MQRGDYIIRINGVQLTLDNYKVQLGLIDKPHTLITLRVNSTSGALEPRPEISLVPVQLAENKENLFLEVTNYGGHCAFPVKDSNFSYAEIKALEFFNSI